ncbi:MAG: hypothetical protein KDA79_14165 [Planctomycetaceae bacterium]|nr:hypothetical protein [Planctomycetaceae bacterium]
MPRHSELQRALLRGLRPEGDLAEEIFELGDYSIETEQDAEAVCQALSEFPRPSGDSSTCTSLYSPLHAITGLFQDVGSERAFEILYHSGMPELLRVHDAQFGTASVEEILYLLKIFAMYRYREGCERIPRAARHPRYQNGFLWQVVFQQLSMDLDDDNEFGTPQADPLLTDLCDELRNPLPQGFAAIAYLDWSNELCRNELIDVHPFDSVEGMDMLEDWLADSDPDEFSYAQSAAVAINWLRLPARSRLVALAIDHPQMMVQLEGAWAAASWGSDSAVKMLSRFCLERGLSVAAREYLEELDREDAIPGIARDPDFEAMSEMCHWLGHPGEFGRTPEDIELLDSRTLYWPPTGDERTLWLFRFHYTPTDDGDEPEVGVGLVGSITATLYDETEPDMTPEEIYALHCCWELEITGDPRAPEERTVEAGLSILREHGSV